jgi:hypothetical protein
MVKHGSQLLVQRKVPDLAEGRVLVALSPLSRSLLRSLLAKVLLLTLWRHVRYVFSFKPKTALVALFATAQVALVRLINLATRAEVET